MLVRFLQALTGALPSDQAFQTLSVDKDYCRKFVRPLFAVQNPSAIMHFKCTIA